MKLRNPIAGVFAACILASSAVPVPAAAIPGAVPKTILVLADVSRSIPTDDRKKIHRPSFASVLASLKPGDRLVLGPLGAKDRSTWLSDFDARYPLGGGFRLADERAAAEFSKKAAKAFDAIMERGEKNPDNATRIADAVEAASEAFGADPKNSKILVILSDMEESNGKQLKQRKAPASLEGASVYVAGAGGGARYSEYESAWRGYFGAARVSEMTYGRFPARVPK